MTSSARQDYRHDPQLQGLRIVLPRRRLAWMRLRIVSFPLILSLMVLGAVAYMFGSSALQHWLFAVPTMLGAVTLTTFLFGWSEVTVDDVEIRVTARVGPFRWTRLRPREASCDVSVCEADVRLEGESASGFGVILIEFARRRPMYFATMYPVELLCGVADDIRSALSNVVGLPELREAEGDGGAREFGLPSNSKLELQHSLTGLPTVTVPREGFSRDSIGRIATILALTVVIGLPVSRAEGTGANFALLFVLLLGGGGVLLGLHLAIRRRILEVTDDSLLLRCEGVLGSSTRSIPLSRIHAIEVARSRTSETVHELVGLRVLTDGRPVDQLGDLPELELHWIAAVLWRGVQSSRARMAPLQAAFGDSEGS